MSGKQSFGSNLLALCGLLMLGACAQPDGNEFESDSLEDEQSSGKDCQTVFPALTKRLNWYMNHFCTHDEALNPAETAFGSVEASYEIAGNQPVVYDPTNVDSKLRRAAKDLVGAPVIKSNGTITAADRPVDDEITKEFESTDALYAIAHSKDIAFRVVGRRATGPLCEMPNTKCRGTLPRMSLFQLPVNRRFTKTLSVTQGKVEKSLVVAERFIPLHLRGQKRETQSP